MEFIAKDGTKFTNYDDARKYEEELDNSVTLEKCVADLRSGVANNKVFIANIKENDGKISSTILIHDDNGIDNNLKEAIILNTYGEPVSFFPNTFSADVVYTIEPIKQNDKYIETIAEALTGNTSTFNETESFISINGVVIYSRNKNDISKNYREKIKSEGCHCIETSVDFFSKLLGLYI